MLDYKYSNISQKIQNSNRKKPFSSRLSQSRRGDDMGEKDIQEIIGYAQKLNGQFCIKVWPTTAADWDDILSKI